MVVSPPYLLRVLLILNVGDMLQRPKNFIENRGEMLQHSDISKILMTIPVFDLPEIVFLSAELPNTRKAFGRQASV